MLFGAMLVTPSLGMVLTGAGSMATGLMIPVLSGLCLWAMQSLIFPTTSRSRFYAIGLRGSCWLLIGVTLHVCIANQLGSIVDFSRCASSVFLLLLLFAFSTIAARQLTLSNSRQLDRRISIISVLLAINAIVGLLDVRIGSGSYAKQIFAFSEPSHFALVCAPFLIYRTAKGGRWAAVAMVIVAVWAVGVENLTMLIAVALAACVVLRPVTLICAGMSAGALLISLGNAEYFASRAIISTGSDNASVLVLLHGWEVARLSIEHTLGWGVGFQQFGVAGLGGDVVERIEELTGGIAVNRFDGGSTASKLVGEFGLFGIAALGMYLILAVKSFRFLRIARR
ncbi:MAG: hypothetical protein ACRDHN_05800, partial [Thermomicrobiales bacterium]